MNCTFQSAFFLSGMNIAYIIKIKLLGEIVQRSTNRRKLERDRDQLLEQFKREEDNLADLSVRQAEALQQSEGRYRTLFDQLPVGAYIYDKEFKITQCNERATQIIGKHFSIFYPEEDIEHSKPQHELDIAVREGRCEDEGWGVRKDGSRFWANVVITALRDNNGRLLAFSKITRDLTERKLHEEALRQSEERFRLLIEGVVDYAIFMLDPEGLVTSWNAGAERIKGYKREEILGKHVSRFYLREEVEAGKPW